MATEGPVTLDGAGVASVMTQYDTVLLDCDGVLWGSNHVTPLPGESNMWRHWQVRQLTEEQTFELFNYLRWCLCQYLTSNNLSMNCRMVIWWQNSHRITIRQIWIKSVKWHSAVLLTFPKWPNCHWIAIRLFRRKLKRKRNLTHTECTEISLYFIHHVSRNCSSFRKATGPGKTTCLRNEQQRILQEKPWCEDTYSSGVRTTRQRTVSRGSLCSHLPETRC